MRYSGRVQEEIGGTDWKEEEAVRKGNRQL